ncbi:MAG: hypothetical protein Q8M92_01845 [Candidatus Subteraquimicrobiales bacterium]|nr:hypothetical protein [Candidatus Subteraquimicrobiales bacterium]
MFAIKEMEMWAGDSKMASSEFEGLSIQSPRFVEESILESKLTVAMSSYIAEIFRTVAEGAMLKSIHFDDDAQLHSSTGPAVEYFGAKVNKIYYLHGLKVPEKLIEAPETLTKEDFIKERNVELRRVMIEHLGADKFAEIHNLVVLDVGKLNGQTVELVRSEEEDDLVREHATFVKVICPSTDRNYFLPVPGDFTDALEALAWTFKMEKEEYKPDIET